MSSGPCGLGCGGRASGRQKQTPPERKACVGSYLSCVFFPCGRFAAVSSLWSFRPLPPLCSVLLLRPHLRSLSSFSRARAGRLRSPDSAVLTVLTQPGDRPGGRPQGCCRLTPGLTSPVLDGPIQKNCSHPIRPAAVFRRQITDVSLRRPRALGPGTADTKSCENLRAAHPAL